MPIYSMLANLTGEGRKVESEAGEDQRSQQESRESGGEFFLLFVFLKIFELEGRHIHCLFDLLIFRIKGEDAFPQGDGQIQVAGSILFEAIFEKDFLTVPNLRS